jgi:hypothetical protein
MFPHGSLLALQELSESCESPANPHVVAPSMTIFCSASEQATEDPVLQVFKAL